jgi:hypothetical protein
MFAFHRNTFITLAAVAIFYAGNGYAQYGGGTTGGTTGGTATGGTGGTTSATGSALNQNYRLGFDRPEAWA